MMRADCECTSRFTCRACLTAAGPTLSLPEACIRCGKPNGRDAAKDDVSAADYVPFQHRYCGPCVKIRRAERRRELGAGAGRVFVNECDAAKLYARGRA